MKKLILTIIMAITVTALAGCGLVRDILPKVSGGDYGKEMSGYNVGDAVIAGTVDALDIEWAAGEVNIVFSKSEFRIEEEPKDLPDEEKFQWKLDGTTLKIRSSNQFKLINLSGEKKLTVTIPEGANLKVLKAEVASADINVASVSANEVELDTASGKINCEAIYANTVKLDSSSGDIYLGKVSADKFEVDSASGNVRVDEADVSETEIGTASGEVEAGFSKVPRNMEIDTASGKVSVALPEDGDYTVDVETASGDVAFGVPAKMKGDEFVVGNGGPRLEIETASGDVFVDAWQSRS